MTAKEFDDPLLPLALAVITLPAKLVLIATFPVHTPAVKAVVLVGEIVPVLSLKLAVLVNEVTVLLNTSLAVMVMLNATPAVCGLLIVAKAK